MIKITEFLTKKTIDIDLKATDKKRVIEELVNLLVKEKQVKDLEKAVASILEREKIGTTGIGQGVAIPHGRVDEVERLVGAFGISKRGIDFDALDGEPVHLIFLLLSPPESGGQHLRALSKISRLFKDKFFKQMLLEAKTVDEVFKILIQEEQY